MSQANHAPRPSRSLERLCRILREDRLSPRWQAAAERAELAEAIRAELAREVSRA